MRVSKAYLELSEASEKLTGDETLEEGLASEVSVVLLEVLLGGGGELHGNELEATVLEARDDGANQAALVKPLVSFSANQLYCARRT